MFRKSEFDIRSMYVNEDRQNISQSIILKLDAPAYKLNHILPGAISISSVSDKVNIFIQKSYAIEPFESPLTSFTLCFWFKLFWPRKNKGIST